jgi:hypothetical protein
MSAEFVQVDRLAECQQTVTTLRVVLRMAEQYIVADDDLQHTCGEVPVPPDQAFCWACVREDLLARIATAVSEASR